MTKETKSALTVGGIALAAVVILFIVLGNRGGSDGGTHAHADGQVHADHGPEAASLAASATHTHADGQVHAAHGPTEATPGNPVEEVTAPTLGVPAPDITPGSAAPAAPTPAPAGHGHDHGHAHGPADDHAH